jgi:signal transduction histidine kinase
MNTVLLIITGIETVFLVFLVSLFIRKSKTLSELIEKVSEVRRRHEDVQKDQDSQVTMLVHDFRSPLGVIKGSADIMLAEADHLSKKDIEKLLKQIKYMSDDLLVLTGNILDATTIKAGKFKVDKIDDDINMLIQGEADSFLSLVNKRKIKLRVILDHSIPKVSLDHEKIKRVLNNIISNAVKFTPNEGRIVIVSKKEKKLVEISVSDTGCGVSSSLKPKLFHKFVRGDTGKEGNGLGLVIAKNIVEAHGGKIWVEDNKPRGARFIFTLPL